MRKSNEVESGWVKKHETLWELWIGCVVSGVVFQIGLMWFFSDKIAFSLSLWIGVLVSLYMAWHMERNANKIVSGSQGAADRIMRLGVLIRYFVVTAVLLLTAFVSWLHPIPAFVGVMALKIAAYMQPLTHKVLSRMRRHD